MPWRPDNRYQLGVFAPLFRLNDHDSVAANNARFVASLRSIVGRNSVLVGDKRTARFRMGVRFGGGSAIAVVLPHSLVQLWRIARVCVDADKIIIMQAANTSLTGGATPFGDLYDRDVVIINTSRIRGIHVIEQGRQVICLPGATLFDLENVLIPFDREPHSVIGSSCIGASVVGGICNNSGGALLKRGPAFTQMALFGAFDQCGQLRLVNHLGINLGENPEIILSRVEKGKFILNEIEHDPALAGADHGYAHRVRNLDAEEPARFNADPKGLFEASGSAGKIVVFAVRLDTFPKETRTKVFYIGSNDPFDLERTRRNVLKSFKTLPISAEYIHRDAYNLAEVYGKDTFLAIQYLGTSRLPRLYQVKDKFDRFARHCGFRSSSFSDGVLQQLARMHPNHLPARMNAFRDRFEHHLLLKVGSEGIAEAADYLNSCFPSERGDYFECTEEEAKKAFLHRFVVAGAAIRYRTMHEGAVEEIVALDVALRRNDTDWFRPLPADIEGMILHKLHYGHFFCHVFHQDYIVAKPHDPTEVKSRILADLRNRGAEFPAEHNVGHLYEAKAVLAEFYKKLDPRNALNPGIGRTSRRRNWA